jgi:hypothetical protein
MNYRDKLDSRVLRRLNDDDLEYEFNFLLDEHMSGVGFNPCDYDYVSYFVEDVCEELRGSYLDNIEIKTNPKTSDVLYYYLIDKFGDRLVKIYDNKKC